MHPALRGTLDEERRLRNGLLVAAGYVLFFALAARVAFDPATLF